MTTQHQWLFEAPFQLTTSSESLRQSTSPQFESAQEWEFQESGFYELDAMATDKSGKAAKPTTATPKWFGKFQEPLHKSEARAKETEILQRLAECHKLGTGYQQLVAEDLRAPDVQEKFKKQKLRIDIGTGHEVTTEGRNGKFSPRKMEQLKTYLGQVGGIMLTVPKLSKEAEKQLIDLGEEFKKQSKKAFRITVRETCPSCKI